MEIHSSMLAWRIPWTGEPGGLQFMGLQRVRHDWAINTYYLCCVEWPKNPPPKTRKTQGWRVERVVWLPQSQLGKFLCYQVTNQFSSQWAAAFSSLEKNAKIQDGPPVSWQILFYPFSQVNYQYCSHVHYAEAFEEYFFASCPMSSLQITEHW